MAQLSFLKTRAPSKEYFELLKRRFEEKRQKWNLNFGFDFHSPDYNGNEIKFDFKRISDGPATNLVYATPLFLSGLATELHHVLAQGRRSNILNDVYCAGIVYPITAGVITEAKRKGAKYAVGHIPQTGFFDLKLNDNNDKTLSYTKCRTFVLLPDPLHAENFALASTHSEGTYVRSILPFAVGFVNASEHKGFVLLETVQANFSRRKLGEKSTLPDKDQIITNKIDDHYSHWKRILLRHTVDYYLKRGKKVVFPDATQYAHMWPSAERAANAIERDFEKTAEHHNYTTRELTEKELKKFQLDGAVGKFKIIERKE